MSDEQIERLYTDGFMLEAMSVAGEGFGARYGSGFAEGIRTGHAEGIITWKFRISALPDFDDYMVDASQYGFGFQTRWQYLWDFYVRHNVANWHKVFWVRDLKTKRDYLAEIVEEQLDFQMFCLMVSGAGLTIRQRRVYGVESPSLPNVPENNVEL
jgi:hypothetical protein